MRGPKLSLVFVCGLFLLIAAVLGYFNFAFHRAGPSQEARVLFVEPGMGLNSISARLRTEQIIENPVIFRFGSRLFGEDGAIKTGEYRIPAKASMAEILALMQSGAVVMHKITVPEGATAAQIIAELMKDERLKGDVAFDDIEEGTLLPETYFFARGDERSDIIIRMQTAMTEALDAIWSSRQEGLAVRTKEEALILASIIEKETALPEERGRISGVFTNRLRRGIRLQSDPTVIYGLAKGQLGRSLTVRDLDSDTPYNTYKIKGLPVGPIANPGVDSLKAAVAPLDTDELYFVADGTGGHAFSKTLKEHNEKVRKWRRIEAQRRQARKGLNE